MINIPKEYKGLKVIRKWSKGEVNASYNRFSQVITIYDIWLTQTEANRKAILEHEYAHHIFWKMPLLYQKLWGYISNWKLIKLLNIMWLTSFKHNAYVTSYAKKNVREDWSECIEAKILIWQRKFHSYADFKINVSNSMYNYFSNK